MPGRCLAFIYLIPHPATAYVHEVKIATKQIKTEALEHHYMKVICKMKTNKQRQFTEDEKVWGNKIKSHFPGTEVKSRLVPSKLIWGRHSTVGGPTSK